MTMKKQRGVTIVEGLVALVILSVGMLGIASLYVASLKTGRTALTRTQAVNLVNDLIDSIRSNGTARTAYRLAAGATPEAKPECLTGGDCDRDELAETDLARWLDSVTTNLPDGTGVVTVTPDAAVPNTPDIYTIAVSWLEPGETQRYSYRASVEMLPVRP
jgi:type IV pilus assembly protein PilV